MCLVFSVFFYTFGAAADSRGALPLRVESGRRGEGVNGGESGGKKPAREQSFTWTVTCVLGAPTACLLLLVPCVR